MTDMAEPQMERNDRPISPRVFPGTAVLAQQTRMIMNNPNSLSPWISLSNKCITHLLFIYGLGSSDANNSYVVMSLYIRQHSFR